MPDIRYWDHRYESAEPDEIRALQLGRVRELIGRAWATNPFYRQRFARAGIDPSSLASLEQFAATVPTVTKAAFVADQNDCPPYGLRHAHALELQTGLFVYTTSGTSGQGQEIHMQTQAELDTTSTRVYPYLFRWAGLTPGSPLLLAMPVSMLGGGRLEYHGAVGYGLTVLTAGTYDADRKVQLIRRFRPASIVANSSYFGRLGAILEQDGGRAAGLAAIITGGEASGIAWLERMQEVWGVPAYDRYGSSQAGNDHMFTCEQGIGSTDRPGMLHNIDPFMLVEVIDPETGRHVADGEQGELVITNLYRMDTPLIRWKTGDRAIFRTAGYCPCGRPFSGVEVASIGRLDDMRKIKGVNVWPQAVDDAVFSVADVQEYQVLLSSTPAGADDVLVRVLPSPGKGQGMDELRGNIATELHRRIGINFNVEVVEAGAIDIGEWKARRWMDNRTHLRSN